MCGAGLLAVTAAVVLLVWWRLRKTEPPPAPDPFALPPLASSPFLNTGPDAHYVGSETCLPCHKDEHASFRHTGMGRSMADVDLDREPRGRQPSIILPRNAVTKSSARTARSGTANCSGRTRRRKYSLEEHPVKYVVGSGGTPSPTWSRWTASSESPVTWYPSQSAWGMSPGYDGPNQFGFSRAVGEGCLYCHAGRSEVVGQSLHRMSIPEEAIGCERCHGPGSVHVASHAGRPADEPAAAVDYTIVNPAHLSRELSEAVCQQCHLKSVATIPNRGRKLSDFRPGLPLEDFRQDYVPERRTRR